jgi:hypothetical protein
MYGTDVRDWVLDPNDKAYGKGSRAWYALGQRMRNEGRGLEYWHTGTFRRRLPPDKQGAISVDTSNLAVHIDDGTSWFMHSTPVILGGARAELDRELLKTHRALRR